MERNVITKLNKKLKTAYFKEKLPKGSNVEDFRNFCTEISERFNNYFVNIAEELGIYNWEIFLQIALIQQIEQNFLTTIQAFKRLKFWNM